MSARRPHTDGFVRDAERNARAGSPARPKMKPVVRSRGVRVMKTLSQHLAERNAADARREEEERLHCEDLVRTADAVPHDKWVNEAERMRWRTMLTLDPGTQPIGIACDNCGTELATDNLVLTSNPPKKYVGCAGCGFSSSTRC